jgi:putative copper export protein
VELVAIIGVLLYTLIDVPAWRIQRFALDIARRINFDSGGAMAQSGQLSSLQTIMSPYWILPLQWAAYVPLAVSGYAGFTQFGWVWLVGLLIWVMIGKYLVHFNLPIPSRAQCLRIAKTAAARDLGLALRNGDTTLQQLVVKVIVELESISGSGARAGT